MTTNTLANETPAKSLHRGTRAIMRIPMAVTVITALALQLATMSAFAQAKWYTVEVTVFERTSESGLGAEFWPENVDEPRSSFALSPRGGSTVGVLTAGASEPSAIAAVPRGQLAYGGIVKRLRRSGRYRPLVHLGWRQPGLAKTEALPVRVAGSSSAAPDASRVRGTLRLYRSRYLHLEADLVYTRPNADVVSLTTRFSLQESRRMRSGELHYLDHPLFGVLVRATPYQAPGGEYVPSKQPAEKQPVATPTAAPAKPANNAQKQN